LMKQTSDVFFLSLISLEVEVAFPFPGVYLLLTVGRLSPFPSPFFPYWAPFFPFISFLPHINPGVAFFFFFCRLIQQISIPPPPVPWTPGCHTIFSLWTQTSRIVLHIWRANVLLFFCALRREFWGEVLFRLLLGTSSFNP